jgi:PAS domain S-box-containing protein
VTETIGDRSVEILESISDAFYGLDREFCFTYVNACAERLWGKNRTELLGRRAEEVFPIWVGSASHEAHRQALNSGRRVDIETMSRVLNRPVELSIYPTPGGLSVYFRDLSHWKRLEQELRAREELLALAESSAGLGVWDVDLSTGTVRGTSQLYRLFGLPADLTVVSMETLKSRRHPEDRERVSAELRQAAESGADGFEIEYRIVLPESATRWVFSRGRVHRDEHGAAVRYTGVHLDITERKATERALQEVQERYKRVVENANDLIFTLDLNFVITSANPVVQNVLGYTPDELIGTALSAYIPPEQLAVHREMLQKKLHGEEETRYEIRVTHRSGRELTLETSSKLSFDETGHPEAIHAIARDVTHRRLYEEHLALTVRELSHRTKNILAIVQAMVRQVGRATGSFAEFQRRFDGCIQALAVCHDLLVETDWRGAELGVLLERQLHPFAAGSGRQFDAAGPAVMLSPYASQLVGLAIHELATNALKHGALLTERGHVQIRWHRSGSGVLELMWSERGGPVVSQPTRRGFGTTVLHRAASSLGPGSEPVFRPEGLEWTLVIAPDYLTEERFAERTQEAVVS